ncbi:hypothetical protein ABT275_05925 [Streptomyces sp. NPDC001185]|uniref:hypothetical protein n=1 Tax=Streptomyces sp. NPDC001185 TaxID=3154380 RepID=UPI0033239579
MGLEAAHLVQVGWRAAEWTTAEIMIQRGEGHEALAVVSPDAAEKGERGEAEPTRSQP